MTQGEAMTLNDFVLLAALEISDGDVDRQFTAEELLVEAWKLNPDAFGLRGFEDQHPDANKVYTKLDGRKGLVAEGFITKSGRRVYRLTPRGLAAASRLRPGDTEAQAKMYRVLQTEVAQILGHPVFALWQEDPERPTRFREAGHFWGIAPGTPALRARERVSNIDHALREALRELDLRGTDVIVEKRGRPLFERNDIERCMEFQSVLKDRFRRELQVLDPEGPY